MTVFFDQTDSGSEPEVIRLPKPLERLLDFLLRILQERQDPKGVFQRGLRGLRHGVLLLNVGNAGALLLLCLLLEGVGEQNWVLSILLFVPVQLWLIPSVILLGISLFFRPRLAVLPLVCLLLVLFGYMHFSWHSPRHEVADAAALTIVSNNIGQNQHKSIQPFLDRVQPDILLLQAARNRGARYRRRFPKRQVAVQDEFILISRYPILNSGLVRVPTKSGKTGSVVAAWFDVAFAERTIRIYSVHLPTPRNDLNGVRSPKGLARELLRPFLRPETVATTGYRAGLARRVDATKAVLATVRKAPDTVLVAGDFNLPDHGPLYRALARQLQDGFRQGGRGYGFTFPGTSRNPLAFFGPWLRLDYIFSGAAWKLVWFQTEPRRRSQHRAVAARFILRR